MTEKRKSQLEIEVDASGARRGFGEIEDASREMGAAVAKSGQQAADGIDKIGAKAEKAAAQQERAYGRIEAEIRRVTAAAQAAAEGTGRSGEILNKAVAQGLDVSRIEPQLKKLRELDAATKNMGVSAAQTAAALRGVPAQFSDIITSLQGGQAPMTVLLQQGGQLKDMFGGVGAAAKALSSYVLSLVNPFTVAAAAAGALAIAYKQGSEEAQAFSRSIILSGNAAGASINQLQAIRETVAASANVTQGAVADALGQIVATGRVSANVLGSVAEAAVLMEKSTGKAIGETVKEFEDLGKSPVEASLKLNEQYRYLTASVYQQIKALEDQGKTAEAAALAQKSYADAVTTRAKEVSQTLGTLETAWKGIVGAAKGAWDAMLGVGRESSIESQIAKVKERIAQGGGLFGTGIMGASVSDLKGQLAVLEAQLDAQRKRTALDAQSAASEQAKITWLKEGEKYLSKEAQMKREIALIEEQGKSAGASRLDIEKRIAAVREKYTDKSAISELKREASELEKLMDRIAGKDIGLDGGFWKDLDVLFKAYGKGKVTLEEYSSLVTRLIQQQPFYVKGLKEEADALKVRSDMMSRLVGDAKKQAESAEKANEALRDEVAVLGLSKEEQAAYRAAKLESAAASDLATAAAISEQAAYWEIAGVLPDIIAGYEQLAAAKRESAASLVEQAALVREKAAKEVAVKAAEDSAKAWEKFASDIEQSLTDSLYRAFESGESFGTAFVKSLQNTIKTAALKLAVQVVVGTGGNLVAQAADSVLGTKMAGSGSSLLGTASNVNSLYNAFSGGGVLGSLAGSSAAYGAAIGTTSIGAGSQAAMLAAQTGAFGVEGAAATAAAAGTISSEAAAAASSLASAASWALPAIGALAFVATNFKKIVGGQKSMGDGVQIVGSFNDGGFNGMMGQDWQKSGGWFGKKKNGVDWSAISPEIDAAFDDLYKGVKTGLVDIGKRLGDDSVAGLLDGFSMQVDQRSFIQVLSVTANQIGNDLVKAMLSQVAPVVNDVMSRTGSTDWAGTLNTMTANAVGVDQALKLIGTSLEDTFGKQKLNDVLWVTDQFARMFGSVETMGNQLSAYVQNFYSEAELTGKAWAAMGDQFAAIGQTMPETKAGFRSLVESLDLTTESGRQTFASLMTLSPAFAQLAGAAEAAQQKIIEQRQGWQNKLDVLTGATTDRQLQLQSDLASTTDATTQTLIRQVYAQEDLNAAAQTAAEAAAAQAEEARQRAAAIASERYGLETQLLQAQGDTVALRERELAALDESNRALQQQIWALEDARSAAQSAAQAAQEAAQAEAARQAEQQRQAEAAAQQAAAIANERDGLQKRLWQAQGDTAALREAELAALNPANRALQEQIWALEDLAAAAQKATQIESERMGLQKQLWQLQGNTAALRAAELAALDPTNRALQQQIWALEESKAAADEWTRTWENLNQSLRDQAKKLRNEIAGGASVASLQAQFAVATAQARAGDAAAAGRLVGLSDQMMSAYGKSAGSSLDVARMAASLAASLETTASVSTLSAPASDSGKTAQNTAAMAAEIKQLRADSQAQAAAMARLLTELARITSRWDRDGMPNTRLETA